MELWLLELLTLKQAISMNETMPPLDVSITRLPFSLRGDRDFHPVAPFCE
jgi:hypothetical protein